MVVVARSVSRGKGLGDVLFLLLFIANIEEGMRHAIPAKDKHFLVMHITIIKFSFGVTTTTTFLTQHPARSCRSTETRAGRRECGVVLWCVGCLILPTRGIG